MIAAHDDASVFELASDAPLAWEVLDVVVLGLVVAVS